MVERALRARSLGRSGWRGNVLRRTHSTYPIRCQPMRTLIYHTGALGDFITTLPAMEWWRSEHPDSLVVLAGKPELARLAKRSGVVDEIWDVQSAQWAALFNPDPEPAIFAKLRPFSDAILFAADSSPLPQIMHKAGIARVWRQAPFPTFPVPIIRYHLSLFGDRAVRAIPQDPFENFRLEFLKKEDDRIGGGQEVMIHPGSGSAQKNWPFDSFCQLAALLKDDGRSVVWLGGPAEIQLPIPGGATSILDLDLIELALRLSAALLYIGNDSGVTHLAAAVGCPTIALFGPTDPFVWGPSGPNVRIISSGHQGDFRDDHSISPNNAAPMETIGIEGVWRQCQIMLAKDK